MLLTHIINATVLSVDHIGVVPWALFLWTVWLCLHITYKRLFENMLRKINVREPHRRRLIKIYWAITFTAITVPFALQNLNLSIDDIRRKFYHILQNQSWLNRGPIPTIQTKLSYVLLSGFYLNTICEVSIEKGIHTLDFFLHEFLAIFFITTFPLRCVLFGIAFTSIVNVEKFILEFAKLLCTLGGIMKSQVLKCVACFVFSVHTFLWVFIYFHILPKYFLSKTYLKIKQGDSDIQYYSVLLVSTFSLWSFYVLEIFSSPLTRMITNYIYGRINHIENILFTKDPLYEELTKNGTQCCMVEKDEISTRTVNPSVEELDKSRENLLLLYHTVKCMIRIKRKLNRIRAKKDASSETVNKSEEDTKVKETTPNHHTENNVEEEPDKEDEEDVEEEEDEEDDEEEIEEDEEVEQNVCELATNS